MKKYSFLQIKLIYLFFALCLKHSFSSSYLKACVLQTKNNYFSDCLKVVSPFPSFDNFVSCFACWLWRIFWKMFTLVLASKCRCTIFFLLKKLFFCKGRKMWLPYNVEKPTLTTFCRNKEDKKLEHFFGWNCYFFDP